MDATTMRRALGAEIAAETAAQGIKKSALARAVGTDRVTLWRYLSGERPMPLDTLVRVADVLGLATSELMERAERRADRQG